MLLYFSRDDGAASLRADAVDNAMFACADAAAAATSRFSPHASDAALCQPLPPFLRH